MPRGMRPTVVALALLASAILGSSAAVEVSAGYGPPAAANTWQRFSIPLTAAAFGTDAATFNEILSNVTRFRIRTEMHDGTDVGGVDDVAVGSAHSASFDTGPEGWSGSGDGTMAWVATGGHASGFIQISDWASGDWHYAVAPGTWLGDWSALSGAAITFWFKTNYPDYAAVVEISGGSGAVKQLSLTSAAYAVPPSGKAVMTVASSETSATATTVSLYTSNSWSFAVPATVSIPAGETRTTFEAVAGTTVGASATITAAASGFASSRVTLQIVALAPTVSSVTPDSGPVTGGTLVTIRGTGFLTGATVDFGSTAATGVTFVNDTTLTCRTPASSVDGEVTVTVTNPGPLSGAKVRAFTYVVPLTITEITPKVGPVWGGTRVTMTGTGFATSGVVIVLFDSDPDCEDCQGREVTVTSSGMLTCLTPPHAAGKVDVAVFNPGLEGALVPNGYTYADARVSARFFERYAQTMWQSPSLATATLGDSGLFNLVGTMDLTGFDISTLNGGSRFEFGPLNVPGDTPLYLALKLEDDPWYAPGRTSFTRSYGIRPGYNRSNLLVRLSWTPRQLRFSILGWYQKEVDLREGETTVDDGYWLVAQDYLAASSAGAVGEWGGRVSFGNPGNDRTGALLLPYTATAAFRSALSTTGVLRYSKAAVVVSSY